MNHLLRHVRAVMVAIAALALSAGLAFGAQPESAGWGLSNAGAHAGKTVPVKAGQGDEDLDEDTDEDLDEDTDEDIEEDSETAGENCSTDPTTLSDDEIAELRHGSLVCWAAHQDTWPEEFANHGQWVKSWAQWGKDADEETDEETDEDAAGTSAGNGHGNGKAKGHGKPQ